MRWRRSRSRFRRSCKGRTPPEMRRTSVGPSFPARTAPCEETTVARAATVRKPRHDHRLARCRLATAAVVAAVAVAVVAVASVAVAVVSVAVAAAVAVAAGAVVARRPQRWSPAVRCQWPSVVQRSWFSMYLLGRRPLHHRHRHRHRHRLLHRRIRGRK